MMSEASHPGWVGPLLVIFSAVCFGAMPVLGKFAYGEGVAAESLVLIRFALAALMLWALTAARSARAARSGAGPVPPKTPTGPKVILVAIGLGALGYAAQSSFYFAALEVMDASVLAILLYTFPAMVTIGAFALGWERPTVPKLVALVVALGGTMLVVLGSASLSFPLVGTLLALAAALTYTTYILVSDTVAGRLEPIRLSAIIMTSAAGSLAARAAVTGEFTLPGTAMAWFWIGAIALVSTVVAMTAFFAGLARTGPTTTAILSTSEPVTTAALATLVLGEVLTGTQLMGGMLVLGAVLLLQWRPRSREHTARHATPKGAASAAVSG